jgi:cytochrome oxidase Cu insertion factor (SCO1/SenC/PrrC family)
VAAIALGAVAGSALVACGSGDPPPPPPSLGVVQDRQVPQVPLLDESGRPASLSMFHGKVVVLAPFLTLCQEECPITTGAFIAMQRDVEEAGLAQKVAFVEVTVDPGRDSPARLAAYSREFGATWPLLTGSPAVLDRLWRFFGVYHQVVPEQQPPALDWWTHTPLTYDVDHSDGFILLDARGHERFITTSPADLHGRLAPGLEGLLDSTGIQNLKHPQSPSWTVPQALGALSWLLGREVPQVG